MRDIEIAKFEGKVLEKLERIEEFIDKVEPRVMALEKYQSNQKAYIAAAVFIGGAIVSLVDTLIGTYSKLKA